jgi:O-antigen ligase
VPLLLIVAGIAAIWIGIGGLAERISSSGQDLGERWTQWMLTVDAVRAFWLFGVGAGNYVWVFPMFQDETLRPLLYDHAHSDYLELFLEQGLIGFTIIAAAIVLILSKVAKAYRARRDPFLRGVLFGSLTGMLAMLIHALVEFNFQIPANAAWFFVLAGVGLSAANMPSQHSAPFIHGEREG